MDDVGGGGTVLSLAQHEFGWVAGLLDKASYDEPTGRKLHVALAELGELVPGSRRWRSATTLPVCEPRTPLMTGHWVPAS